MQRVGNQEKEIELGKQLWTWKKKKKQIKGLNVLFPVIFSSFHPVCTSGIFNVEPQGKFEEKLIQLHVHRKQLASFQVSFTYTPSYLGCL